MGLHLAPTTQREALAFIAEHHRHSRPPQGFKFAVAVADDAGVVRGVATAGRPVARGLDDGWTLEVTRCCTDGAANACSMLYGAAWRAARAMGYRRVVTYTLRGEAGASLRASGFRVVGEVSARSWHCESRPRVDPPTPQERLRWEVS